MYVYGKTDFETPKLAGDELTDTVIALILSVLIFSSLIILFYRLRVKPVPAAVITESRDMNE